LPSCAADWGDCLESRCCASNSCALCAPRESQTARAHPTPRSGSSFNPSHAKPSLASADVCYHRTDRNFAQCRPRHDHGGTIACVDDDHWLCPRWKDRVKDWGDCFAPETGRACQSPQFGCFKKRGVEFAQCRPLGPNCTDSNIMLPRLDSNSLRVVYTQYIARRRGLVGTERRASPTYFLRLAGAEWRCPGWEHCSPSGHDCISSKCCDDESYGILQEQTRSSARASNK
jgi:hypothetical protein